MRIQGRMAAQGLAWADSQKADWEEFLPRDQCSVAHRLLRADHHIADQIDRRECPSRSSVSPSRSRLDWCFRQPRFLRCRYKNKCRCQSTALQVRADLSDRWDGSARTHTYSSSEDFRGLQRPIPPDRAL